MDRISAHAIPGKKTVLQPEAKKRNMQGVRPHTAQSRDSSNPATKTGNWDEALYEQQHNKYVLSGYRTGKAEALTSLKFLHNETGNIYMHLWSSTSTFYRSS